MRASLRRNQFAVAAFDYNRDRLFDNISAGG